MSGKPTPHKLITKKFKCEECNKAIEHTFNIYAWQDKFLCENCFEKHMPKKKLEDESWALSGGFDK